MVPPCVLPRASATLVVEFFCLAFISMSCGDPVRDDGVAALGPETPGVPRGSEHRPGQPCLLCHSDDGQSRPFSVAGTVYLDAASQKPADNVAVQIIDAQRTVFTAITNCVGNFYVQPSQFSPTYPIWVTMRAGNVQRDMDSPSYREGSCAACHTDPRGPTSAGHVYLIDDPAVETAPPSRCN